MSQATTASEQTSHPLLLLFQTEPTTLGFRSSGRKMRGILPLSRQNHYIGLCREQDGRYIVKGGDFVYQALYRKWRPRTFDDVVGQEQVTETLKNQIINNRTSHAYLMIGVRGTGKTTCAKILARALNCEHPENGNPCNKCDSCIGIESGSVMDVVEIDAASNNGVENVRALRDEAVYTPASVKKRVYIIDEVHMLTTSAFNALLKILEEPPEHLVFILATTEIHKVLPTILSRCQRYSFKRIAPEAIAGRLEYVADQENIPLEKDAAQLLARLADGSMRDGLSLLDQCSGSDKVTAESVLSAMGLAGNYNIARLLSHIAEGQTSGAIELFETLWRDGKAPATLLSEMCTLLRDVMMLKVAPKNGKQLISGGFDDNTLYSLGASLSSGEAMEYLEQIQESIGKLRDGRDPKIEAELCIISLCEPQLLDTPERLAQRIAKLEKALQDGEFVPVHSQEEPIFSEAVAIQSDDSGEKDDLIAEDNENKEVSEKDTAISDSDTVGLDSVEAENEAVAEAPDKSFVDEDIWPALYARFKSEMPPPMFALLSDGDAKLRDGKTVIFVTSAFKKGQLENNSGARRIISGALSQLIGGTGPFIIEETKIDKSGKLDELSKFGNVEFQ